MLGEERLVVEFLPLEASLVDAADTGRRRFRATAYGDEAARILRDGRERWERLEREKNETPAAVGRDSRRAEAKLVLALVVSGLLGLRAIGGPSEAPTPACTALAPAKAGVVFGGPARDELGGLQVVCADERTPARQSAALEGIARLLDGRRIDPNTAPRALLENLPGIGRVRAEAIVRERDRRLFDSIRDLERVPGIGPKTREKLEPFLAVDSGAPSG